MRLLVSGVAGGIGLGVGRVIREWDVVDRLYGIDVLEDHPAKIFFHEVAVSPRAEDSFYVEWLLNYISDNRIDIFIPTSEAEVSVVSRNLNFIEAHCKVLINDPLIISKCFDKHETLEYLSVNNISVPRHGIIGRGEPPLIFPIIAKPRIGRGSKGIMKINSEAMLADYCPDEYVWQEFLAPDQEEYTCAVYLTKSLSKRFFILNRSLLGGYTSKGVVVNNKDISEYLSKISDVFDKPGLFNVQLRLTDDGPKLFEINPRISSTVVFRDKLGFHDLRWWISECLNLMLPEFVPPEAGTRIYRGDFEYIIEANKNDQQ